jgi:hypothetical protein
VPGGVLSRPPDRRAALAFNQSLPCKADITDIKDKGATTLAAFRLREGPGGPAAACSGLARVRFKLRGGRFTEWRQLPERPQPEGKTA